MPWARDPAITSILAQLLGPAIRPATAAKLNMKSAGYGSAGRMASGLGILSTHHDGRAGDRHLSRRLRTSTTARLMVLPGTHRGPTFDHHGRRPLLRGDEPGPIATSISPRRSR